MTLSRPSRRISYRRLGPSMVVLDHANGELYELEASAGEVLERLDRGQAARSAEELEVEEALAELGMLERTGEPCGAHGEAAHGRREGPDETTGPSELVEGDMQGSADARASAEVPEHPDLLEALNRRAELACVPLHAQIELTQRCPLGCDYCYLEPLTTPQGPELSTTEVVSVLDQLAELGTLFVLLTGGEPLVRRDLEPIIAHARARRFAVSLLTSGWALDATLAERLAENGMDSVQITLHDADRERHDARTRVAGSFDAAVRAIRIWRDLGVRTQIAFTVTRASQAHVDDVRALAERLRVPVNLSGIVLPRRDGSQGPRALQADERGLLAAFEAFPSRAPGRLAGRGLDERPCGAGCSAVAIDARGTVYPCHLLRVAVGSTRREALGDIWHGAPELERMRALRIADLRDCPTCSHRSHCNRCAGFAVATGASVLDHCAEDCVLARLQARGEPGLP